jgi:hypothetical protein
MPDYGGQETVSDREEPGVNPKLLEPGMGMRHRRRHTKTLKARKEDDSGWWLAEGGGLADRVIEQGDWTPIPHIHHIYIADMDEVRCRGCPKVWKS